MATVNLGGNPVNTNGDLPAVGSTAPAFRLVDKNLNDVGLDAYDGKKKILSINPSLDTSVCSTVAKTFNERIGGRDDVVVLVVSADLPFAQARWCGAESVDNAVTLSMMRSRNFAKDYGVLLEDGPLAGLTARAVLALDANNNVLYGELVSEVSTEPNYDAAIDALG